MLKNYPKQTFGTGFPGVHNICVNPEKTLKPSPVVVIFSCFFPVERGNFWLKKVPFAWIKVAYVQSWFSSKSLNVQTWFQDRELGWSTSFAIVWLAGRN